MQPSISDRPINKNERLFLWIFLGLVIIFGGIVEHRSAFLEQRRTDADDFFRAAWGIRKNKDIYELIDTQGWHYNYPPFFAIMIAPLGNPPPFPDQYVARMKPYPFDVPMADSYALGMTLGAVADSNRAGMLPYELSIAIWYVLSVVAGAYAIHWLAKFFEEHFSGPLSKIPASGTWRWWALRMIPTLVCLPSIGRSLSRGQVNLFVLLLFCGVGIFAIKKRNTLAGVLISTAASVKLFPAYLGLYPLWRRDWRGVAGCFIGAFLCLVVVPVVALGPERTTTCYHKFFAVLLGPALTGEGDKSRATELLNTTGTDSQSFLAMIHNAMYPFTERPPLAAPWVKPVHWALSLITTLVTLWYARKQRPGDAQYAMLFLGTIILCMLPISPVSHTHYFVFALPLVMALTAHSWQRNQAPVLSRGYIILFAIHIIGNVISMPENKFAHGLKNLGFAFYSTYALWFAGLYALRQRSEMPTDGTGSGKGDVNASPVSA